MTTIVGVWVTNHPFEDLPSECDGGAAIVRHGQVSKWHS